MSDEPQEIQRDLETTRRDLRDDVTALAERVRPSRAARRQAHRVAAALSEARERVRELVVGTASDVASDTARQASRARAVAADTVREVPDQARRHTQGHPLTAGLLAVGAGWLLSTLLPASSAERRAAERSVDAAAGQVQPLAEQAVQLGSSAAANLAEPAKRAAATVQDAVTRS